MLTVYHGSTQTVDAPVCAFGRPRLDFGQGFYVTDIKEQAERWAKALAGKRDTEPVLNIYHLDREQILSEGRCKIFTSYIQGLIDAATALQQLAFYKPNNQICLLNQSLTDKYLHFYGSERI